MKTMKKAILGLVLAVAVALVPASAGTIGGLFNTGTDNNGVVLADGSSDMHYILISQPNMPGSFAPFVVNSGNGANNVYPFTAGWVPDNTTSKWIGPQANQSTPGPTEPAPGNYTYRLYFQDTGNPAGDVITGKWASDNVGTIFCASGCTVTFGSPNMGLGAYTTFSISNLASGSNAIDFIVNNAGSVNTATGLRVDFVPEPGTMMLGALGLLAVGLLRRRRS